MTKSEQPVHVRIKWLLTAACVLVAIGTFLVVWVPYHRQMQLIDEIESFDDDEFGFVVVGLPRIKRVETDAVGPDWLRDLVGDERMSGFDSVVLVYLVGAPIDDAWLKKLGRFPKLYSLVLDGKQITDDGLTHLAEMSNLRILILMETGVSDKGVKKLQQALPDCIIVK